MAFAVEVHDIAGSRVLPQPVLSGAVERRSRIGCE